MVWSSNLGNLHHRTLHYLTSPNFALPQLSIPYFNLPNLTRLSVRPTFLETHRALIFFCLVHNIFPANVVPESLGIPKELPGV
jgi:hypothetical protein